ncbi:MAG: hypothetical protein IJ253_07040 [Bacteroidaceae bacterium]|nr:hypothetical protein [Bacteroidaceae bacterium]MBR1593794.1 hypothetical protein [Alloprevotella sp.]
MKELKSDILLALVCALVFAVCIFFAGYGYKWIGSISWIPFLGFCFYAYKAFKGWQTRDYEEDASEDEPAQAVTVPSKTDARDDTAPDTRSIALAALKRLGCSPEEIDGRSLLYTFQGFYFVMDFDASFFARIALMPTTVCRKSDVVTFMELQDILNLFNKHNSYSYYWVEMNASDGEEQGIGFIIKDFLMLHPALPHAEIYIAKEMEQMIRNRYELIDCIRSRRTDKEKGTKESAASQNAEN